MRILTALEKSGEGRPHSIQIYFDRIRAYLEANGARFEYVSFNAATPSGNFDLIWAPGLGNRRVPPVLLNAVIPTVATVHGLQGLMTPPRFSEFGLRTGIGNYLWRLKIRRDWMHLRQKISHVITVSDAAKQDIVTRLGVPAGRISYIYHGVDTSFQNPASRTEEPYVLHVSQYSGAKNIPRMLKAYEIAAKQIAMPLKALSVGAPEMDLPPECVMMREAVAHTKIPYLMAGAHVFLFPSIEEPFGLPVIEAMSMGLPIVTSRGTGAAEIAGTAGVLVNPHDSTSIADGLIRAATDENLRARLISTGLARAKKFTWEASGRKHLELFERLATIRRSAT